MDSDGRTGLRRIVAPEQAEHLVLKEYATIKLMQVVAELEAAILERNNAFAERKAAFTERDSAFLQRDIAVAERDAAIMERDNAVAALDAARGHRNSSWNHYKRQADPRGKDLTAMQMSLPNAVAFGVEELHTLAGDASVVGVINNGDRVQPSQASQKPNCRPQKKEGCKTKQSKKKSEAVANEAFTPEVKKKRMECQGQDVHVQVGQQRVVPAGGQGGEQQLPNGGAQHAVQECKELENIAIILNRPIPYCSCTGVNQQCYRWGNGGWQSACCTTTMSMHPLPMNPKKRGYRLPGRKMSAGAFQKLAERLTSEGADLNQPIDLKDYWAKHGTNRYVTIK